MEDATEQDVAQDILAIVDEAPFGRLVGSEATTIEDVTLPEPDTIRVTLSNGQRFDLRVRERPSC